MVTRRVCHANPIRPNRVCLAQTPFRPIGFASSKPHRATFNHTFRVWIRANRVCLSDHRTVRTLKDPVSLIQVSVPVPNLAQHRKWWP